MDISRYEKLSQDYKAGKISKEQFLQGAQNLKNADIAEANKDVRDTTIRNWVGGLMTAASLIPQTRLLGGGALAGGGQHILHGGDYKDLPAAMGIGGVVGLTGGKLVQSGLKAAAPVAKPIADKIPQSVKTVLNTKVEDVMPTLKKVNQIKNTTQAGVVGSPRPFEKFSKDAIGSGESNAVHGYGFYANKQDPLANPTAMDRATGYSKTRVAEKIDDQLKINLNNRLTQSQRNLLVHRPDLAPDILDETSGDLIRQKLYYESLPELGAMEKAELAAINRDINIIQDLKYNMSKYVDDAKGVIYDVRMPKENVMLQEGLPLNQQPEIVSNSLNSVYREHPDIVNPSLRTGRDVYDALTTKLGSQKAASDYLYDKGIKGISYKGALDLDANVTFGENDIFKTPSFYPTSSMDNPYEYALRQNMQRPTNYANPGGLIPLSIDEAIRNNMGNY